MVSRKDNYEHIFKNLKEYMFFPENIEKYTNFNTVKVVNNKNFKNIENIENKKVKEEDIFIPKEKDKLYWCIYVIIFGRENYELINNKFFEIEKKHKIETVEKIRENKDKLKQEKLRKTEIEDELVNNDIISLKGLHALALINKLSIIYVSNNYYYKFLYNDDKPYIIINNNKSIGLKINYTEKFLTNILTNYWEIENYNKPLKAFSSYSIKELTDICTRLKINILDNNGKKKIKKTLYENILMNL